MSTVENLDFFTPPENQGQIISTSYAFDGENEHIVRHSFDASDRTENYSVTPARNLKGSFEPWNERPKFHDDGIWEAVIYG